MRYLACVALVLSAALSSLPVAAEERPELSPKEQVEILMNQGLGFAEQQLNSHGEFFPFAVALGADGSVVPVSSYDGREQPPSSEVLELLEQGLREGAQSGEYVAMATFADVLVTPPDGTNKSDAVHVALEHSEGYCANVYFPYRLAKKGSVQFGELFASGRDGVVFACD